MSIKRYPKTHPDQSMVCQFRIKGHLSPQWTDWFEGLTISLDSDGNTNLTGPVIDQAAMHALLRKVRDLGMPLISVNPVKSITANSIAVEDRTEVDNTDKHLKDDSA